MLDIQFIRENADLVAEKSKQKGYEVDIKRILDLVEQRRPLVSELESVNNKSNQFANQGFRPDGTTGNYSVGKQLKEKKKELEAKLKPINDQINTLLKSVPNTFPDDTPLGDESANREEKKWGNVDAKDFEVKDHLTWAEERGLLDFERGAKVAGNKFYFQIGELVELEQAVLQFALQTATKHSFTLMSVPNLVNTQIVEGTGYMAKGEEGQNYDIKDEPLHLIATAEIPLTGFHADEILDLSKPKLYAGISPAYRREAGTYGKHSKGLYRVHQFNKLELYVFCKPYESEEWHKKLVEIEEEICQALEIPYRLVRIASGDLGAPAYKKFDIEYWTPVDKNYRELMSCSNVTDYQARRLKIRYRDEEDNVQYVHTLNGTAAAFSRMAVAFIENHQQADGKVQVPDTLKPYISNKDFIG